jgi:hypothetical protein
MHLVGDIDRRSNTHAINYVTFDASQAAGDNPVIVTPGNMPNVGNARSILNSRGQ